MNYFCLVGMPNSLSFVGGLAGNALCKGSVDSVEGEINSEYSSELRLHCMSPSCT